MIDVVPFVISALLALPGPQAGAAPNPASVLSAAADTIGARGVRTIRFSGSGSSYTYTEDAEGGAVRVYARVREFLQLVDAQAISGRTEILEVDGESDEERNRVEESGADRPWNEQLAIWLTPHVFLAEAIDRNAETVPVEAFGADYTRVRFEVPGGQQLEGFISGEGYLERIQTWVEGPEGALVPFEVRFRFYEDVEEGGGQFPGLIVWKQDGQLTRLVSVTGAVLTRS